MVYKKILPNIPAILIMRIIFAKSPHLSHFKLPQPLFYRSDNEKRKSLGTLFIVQMFQAENCCPVKSTYAIP